MQRSGRTATVACVLAGALCVGTAHAGIIAGPDRDAALQTAGAEGTGAARPQDGGRPRGQYAGMGRVLGQVTAVAGGTLTLKAEDGSTVQIVTTDNTRVMKDRGPVKVSDLHVGDGLMAMGNMDAPNKTLHAAVVFAQDAAQIKAMRENLGKTYITGRVTAINLDDAKMTVERADHVPQTIGFDETTSFKRAVPRGGGAGNGNGGGAEAGGRENPGGGGFGPGGGMGMGIDAGIDRAFASGESVTLADIKVGDFIAGTGTVKNGTFVPTRVVDSPPRPHRARNGAGEGDSSPNPGPASGAAPGPR